MVSMVYASDSGPSWPRTARGLGAGATAVVEGEEKTGNRPSLGTEARIELIPARGPKW